MASISLTLDVETPSGRERVTAGPADFIALERKFQVGAGALQEDPHIEYLAFLAWSAIRRTRPGVPDFDAWLNADLLDLNPEGDDDADPKVDDPPPPSP